MNFKALLFLGTSAYAALVSKQQNSSAAIVLKSYSNQDQNIFISESQAIICNSVKEIIIMADLSGLADQAWTTYATPAILKLVRSFNISKTAARFELFTRSSTAYNAYWCINAQICSNTNNNLLSLVSKIQDSSCFVLSPIGLGALTGFFYGCRRSNTPVEILILTDGLLRGAGLALYEADRIKALGGVRFICAGVGSAVDYGYLAQLCDNNIIHISNYGEILNSVDAIANNLCKGSNRPTTPVPTRITTFAPSTKITATPTSKAPTNAPKISPSNKPSPLLTFSPTKAPRTTKLPTSFPTKAPRTTKLPTSFPTRDLRTKFPTKSLPTLEINDPTKMPTVKRFRYLLF